jgi:hypothetical protein
MQRYYAIVPDCLCEACTDTRWQMAADDSVGKPYVTTWSLQHYAPEPLSDGERDLYKRIYACEPEPACSWGPLRCSLCQRALGSMAYADAGLRVRCTGCEREGRT